MCLCTFQGHNLLFSFEHKYLRNITFLQQIRILGRAFLQRNLKFKILSLPNRTAASHFILACFVFFAIIFFYIINLDQKLLRNYNLLRQTIGQRYFSHQKDLFMWVDDYIFGHFDI